jgi:hypothetical protein
VNLAGGLAGLGTAMTYIGQQGLKDQQDAAHDQALLDREEALKRLEIDAKREDRHNALADAKELSTYTTNEKVRGATAEARALQPIKQGEQDHASALRLKEADVAFDRDMKKLEKTQGFQLSLAQYQAGQEAYRQAAADGRKIVATGVNADGDVTYALGDGGVRIERGMKPTPRGSSASDPIADAINGTDGAPAATGRGGRPVLTPRAAAPAQAAKPDGRFLSLYAVADPKKYPGLFHNGQKIPVDEAWRMYQGAK